MAEQLGRIEKPEAGALKGKRKLCLVPLIFSGKDAPPEYQEKFALYWEQASQQIDKVELQIGKVSHIYLESIFASDEEGLKVLEKLNPSCYQIVQNKCQSGSVLEATDDQELAEECMDWERFLLMGFISQKAADTVSQAYLEASRKRYEHISRRIDETLKADEVGMLFIREGHMLQFPKDIEVFSVAPPALDKLHRWQRERLAPDEKREPKE